MCDLQCPRAVHRATSRDVESNSHNTSGLPAQESITVPLQRLCASKYRGNAVNSLEHVPIFSQHRSHGCFAFHSRPAQREIHQRSCDRSQRTAHWNKYCKTIRFTQERANKTHNRTYLASFLLFSNAHTLRWSKAYRDAENHTNRVPKHHSSREIRNNPPQPNDAPMYCGTHHS